MSRNLLSNDPMIQVQELRKWYGSRYPPLEKQTYALKIDGLNMTCPLKWSVLQGTS